MVDNFNLIRPLLDFGGELDFLTVSLILRKVDHTTTYGNKNNSARIIKIYHFFTIEKFYEKEEEIKALCELFGCRAGVYLNKRNLKKVSTAMMVRLAENINSENWNCLGTLDTIIGTSRPGDKIQFLDCDSQEEYENVLTVLNDPWLRPYEVNKIIAVIPTNKGKHVVTKRFDKEYFKVKMNELDITFNLVEKLQIINPCALYYPIKNDKINLTDSELKELINIGNQYR